MSVFCVEGMVYDVVYNGVEWSVGKCEIGVVYVNLLFKFLVCVYKVDYVDYNNRCLIN